MLNYDAHTIRPSGIRTKNRVQWFSCILIILIIAFNSNTGFATTSLHPNDLLNPADTTQVMTDHSPTKAAMLSATLPGLGQIYNQKYWKVPVIYAGFGTLIYFIDWNNDNYQTYRKAWLARVDGNPHTTDDFPRHSTANLERAMNHYRRNLEVTYILTAALYMLNILDASVDAHLMTFDVGESLSLNLQPVPLPTTPGMGQVGYVPQLKLSFHF